MRSKLLRFFPALSLLVLVSVPLLAQAPVPELDLRQHYVKSERMIPMRDGVKLFTIIYEPQDKTQRYPFLLLRTPYSIRPYGPDEYREQLGPSPEFDREGFIFVFQDVRGKFRSEGEFVVMTPPRTRVLRQPTRARITTTPSNGCSTISTTTTAGWGNGASRIPAIRRSWG